MRRLTIDKRKKKYITKSGIGCFSIVFLFLVGSLIFALIGKRNSIFVIIISVILGLIILLLLFIFLRFTNVKGGK